MRLTVVLFGILVLVAPGASGPVSASVQEVDANLEIALRYLDTLYESDFESLGDQLALDAVFRDPTARPLAGAALSAVGRDLIVAKFRSGAAGARNGGFDVDRHFTTGEFVVLTLVYHTEVMGEQVGVPDAWIPVRVPAVTVLRIVDGKIAEHVDHVDYDELLRQIAEFKAEHPTGES